MIATFYKHKTMESLWKLGRRQYGRKRLFGIEREGEISNIKVFRILQKGEKYTLQKTVTIKFKVGSEKNNYSPVTPINQD
jgi:hypothetical protein